MTNEEANTTADIPSGTTSLWTVETDESLFLIHGVAIGNDDVTRGASGIRKYWPAEQLEQASPTLEGAPLVQDHNNTIDSLKGEIHKTKYQPSQGVLFEAELEDPQLARRIGKGQLEVSARLFHAPVSESEYNEELDAYVMDDVRFSNLSLVLSGASESNYVKMGASEEMSAAELQAAFDVDQHEEPEDDVVVEEDDELESEEETEETVEDESDDNQSEEESDESGITVRKMVPISMYK